MITQQLINLVPNAKTCEMRWVEPEAVTGAEWLLQCPDALAMAVIYARWFYSPNADSWPIVALWSKPTTATDDNRLYQAEGWLRAPLGTTTEVQFGIGLQHRARQYVVQDTTATQSYGVSFDDVTPTNMLTVPLMEAWPVQGAKMLQISGSVPNATDLFESIKVGILVWR